MDKIKIGIRLSLLRGTRTRAEVATAVKISASALAMYELGHRVPRDEIKVRLAKYYGKTVDALFFAAAS